MKDKRWILGLIVVVAAIIGLGVWGFSKNSNNSNAGAGPEVAGTSSLGSQPYYDENANVMEFYQDTCSWCIKEQTVLKQLGDQGYRVKPMNIGANHPENKDFWQKYNISGTPSFVAANGDRLEGYQTEDALKAFLDKHK